MACIVDQLVQNQEIPVLSRYIAPYRMNELMDGGGDEATLEEKCPGVLCRWQSEQKTIGRPAFLAAFAGVRGGIGVKSLARRCIRGV